MTSTVNIEQGVADWFVARLRGIKAADGYSFSVDNDRVFADGSIDVEQDPSQPFIVYDDDSGEWTDASPGDRNAIVQFQPTVHAIVAAKTRNYKRVARKVFDDVVRACSFGQWDTDDKPVGIVGIFPSGWNRTVQDGNYLEVVITFTVRATSDLRNRPLS